MRRVVGSGLAARVAGHTRQRPSPAALYAAGTTPPGASSLGRAAFGLSTHARTALHSSAAQHGDKVKEIEAQIGADDLMTSSITSEDGKVNLYAYNATGLENLLVSWGQPKFRAKQLWQWLHVVISPHTARTVVHHAMSLRCPSNSCSMCFCR